MALWVMMRNALERNLPDPVGGSALAYWKHFLCGGLAGVAVQVPTWLLGLEACMLCLRRV